MNCGLEDDGLATTNDRPSERLTKVYSKNTIQDDVASATLNKDN